MTSSRAFHVGANTDDDGGEDEGGDAGEDESARLGAGALPLLEDESPHGTEDDDTRHVQGPAGEAILAHLGFTHGVEEKLQIPEGAGHG